MQLDKTYQPENFESEIYKQLYNCISSKLNENEIKQREFVCPSHLSDDVLHEYDKMRHIYVQNRQTYKKILKQEKHKNRPLTEEVIQFGKQNKELLASMHSFKCDTCKLYKKHSKNVEVIERIRVRQHKLEKEMERQRDIFWNKFLAHRSVLIDFGYLKDDYPTDWGKTTSQIRSENELYLSQVIFSDALQNLSPAQLAAVVSAITTEEQRTDMMYGLPLSEPVRKSLNLIRNIRRKIDKVQKHYSVEAPLYINPFYSSLIELWVDGAEWETIAESLDIGEGDIVRSFKRTVDVLRQFTTIDNVPEWLVFTAREAIDKILREPVDLD